MFGLQATWISHKCFVSEIISPDCIFLMDPSSSSPLPAENVYNKPRETILKAKNACNDEQIRTEELKLDLTLVSVGSLASIFNLKNGTPRQSGICPQSKGIIRLHKKLFNNPMHALEGIEQFKYIWIIFYFHENTNKRRFIAKTKPPRLNGMTCGVLASRAPVRPNPLGLTLAKLECVKDGLIYVSGIDIIDGTPIIDIKPYIEKYDKPPDTSTDLQLEPIIKCTTELPPGSTPVPQDWVNGSVVNDISVEFTSRSLNQFAKFHPKALHESPEPECSYCFRMFGSEQEAMQAIVNLLKADPRSVYRRTKCVDRLYFFTLDSLHLTAWFDIEAEMVQVVKVKPFLNK